VHTEMGLNSRLDEIQAAILNDAFLPELDAMTQKRQKIAKTYQAQIQHPHILLPPVPEGSHSVWHLFPVLIKENLEDFREYLKKAGVQTGRHYPILIPHQAALKHSIQLTEMTVSQAFAAAEVSLPIHSFMTEMQIQHVIDVCNKWQR
jgi:UDP-2-acetamido-2-deoxy-ribo-hexuluronate aminotransferase